MKKFPILICLLVLIGLGVGCNLNKKDDYQVLKDKFRVLKPIYPTDKIEDLFARFPKGFKILNMRGEGNKESIWSYYRKRDSIRRTRSRIVE